jgi:16S rRNA (guanine966-N2)-methyltransferase
VSRIIAGSRGGRRLATPPGDRTRPTTDRVREALFSAIASWAGTAAGPAEQALAGLAFCDLYSGSGAVGLEAASRGAAPVLLVESNRRTALLTTRNAADLALPAEVRTERVEQLIQHPAGRGYDVVFADPPYELYA